MVDYSKWDALQIDDDETHVSIHGLSADREKLRLEVQQLLQKEHQVDAPLVAFFVAVQRHEAGQPCNHDLHVEIISIMSKQPKLTMPHVTDALCSVARTRFEAKDDRLGMLLLEAINTLEACRRFGGALALYEAICTPTTERAKALREAYAKQTFGKLRLKRHMYSDMVKADPHLLQVLEEHEAKELAAIDPPPRRAPKAQKKWRRWPLWFVCCMVIVLALKTDTVAKVDYMSDLEEGLTIDAGDRLAVHAWKARREREQDYALVTRLADGARGIVPAGVLTSSSVLRRILSFAY